MHAIPNVFTVMILFPLEWITSALAKPGPDGQAGVGVLTSLSQWLAGFLSLGEMDKGTNPVKFITKPVLNVVKDIVHWITDDAVVLGGLLIAVVGLVALFTGLWGLVKNLKGAMLSKMEGLFSKVIFRNDLLAWLSGLATTIAVQSSSVSTSLIVPIAGAGAVKLRRVFPYMLGCNIGTTVTGVLAATANPTAGAVSVAIVHVLFNVFGNIVWYPLRLFPIRIAKWLSSLAARNRKHAFIFLATIFLVIPVIGLVLTELFMF
jgi:sodium-dependent phosphate cotransporter